MSTGHKRNTLKSFQWQRDKRQRIVAAKLTECWGASGTINNEGDGVLLTAVMQKPDRHHSDGTLEAHEYMHAVQIGAFFGTPQTRPSHVWY